MADPKPKPTSSSEELLAVYGPGGPNYDAAKGNALYTNDLSQFPPPPGSVIALVRRGCDHCHAFMAQTNYPTHTPDGRRIFYIDLDTPGTNGKENPNLGNSQILPTDTKAQAFYKRLGLSGDAPFKPVLLNNQKVPGANSLYKTGDWMGDTVASWGAWWHGITDNPYRFPVLFVYHGPNNLEAVSAGVVDGLAWFRNLKQTPGQKVAPAPSAADLHSFAENEAAPNFAKLTPQNKLLVDRAIYGEMREPKNAAGFSLTPAALDEIRRIYTARKKASDKAFAVPPDSKAIDYYILGRREEFAKAVMGTPPAANEKPTTKENVAALAALAPTGVQASYVLREFVRFHGVECGNCGDAGVPIDLTALAAKAAKSIPQVPSTAAPSAPSAAAPAPGEPIANPGERLGLLIGNMVGAVPDAKLGTITDADVALRDNFLARLKFHIAARGYDAVNPATPQAGTSVVIIGSSTCPHCVYTVYSNLDKNGQLTTSRNGTPLHFLDVGAEDKKAATRLATIPGVIQGPGGGTHAFTVSKKGEIVPIQIFPDSLILETDRAKAEAYIKAMQPYDAAMRVQDAPLQAHFKVMNETIQALEDPALTPARKAELEATRAKTEAEIRKIYTLLQPIIATVVKDFKENGLSFEYPSINTSWPTLVIMENGKITRVLHEGQTSAKQLDDLLAKDAATHARPTTPIGANQTTTTSTLSVPRPEQQNGIAAG